MSLIAETSNPLLAQALLGTLQRRHVLGSQLGELEPVAVRLGLLQNSLKPRFRDPQLVLFAADHGLAVDGLPVHQSGRTDEQVSAILTGRQPLSVFARQAGLALTVVDCGVAVSLPKLDGLMHRKIAHGTRNARRGPAMTVDQAQAAIRAGMEIADTLHGNVVACAGLGVGAPEAAALVLSRLTQTPVRELIAADARSSDDSLAHLLLLAQSAHGRHREVVDPVEVLAAFGGFVTAVMVGVMLVAASKRHLILVDGLAACAALWVAARISAPVTDYCVFCRSTSHHGLDRALALFQTTPMLALGLNTVDGTGACLTWPLVRAAAALLSDVADADMPTAPGALPDTPQAAPASGAAAPR
jgi:nicotinate-nucleotide--dimethylbenzimidazole phosphoribosyltransferase